MKCFQVQLLLLTIHPFVILSFILYSLKKIYVSLQRYFLENLCSVLLYLDIEVKKDMELKSKLVWEFD